MRELKYNIQRSTFYEHKSLMAKKQNCCEDTFQILKLILFKLIMSINDMCASSETDNNVIIELLQYSLIHFYIYWF